MQEGAAYDFLQEPLVGSLIVVGKQLLEGVDLRVADGHVEALPDRVCDVGEASPVSHMFVHGPAREGVAKLFQPQVVRRQEPLSTSGTVVPGGSVASDPSLDAAAGDAEVECEPGEAPVLTPR